MATLAATPDLESQEGVIPSLPDQLSEKGKDALLDLAKSCMKEAISQRRSEIRRVAEARNMKDGNQHAWWDKSSHIFMRPEASGLALPRYMDAYNLIGAHWISKVSLLVENAPGVNFVPKSLQRSVDITAASYAERMRTYVDETLDMKHVQGEVADCFCLDGRTVIWSRVEDEQLVCTVHGALETKVPFYTQKMKTWGYAFISQEVDLYAAKDEYPDDAKKIESTSSTFAEMQYERYARLGILADRKGGSGDDLKGLTTRTVGWIRPNRYSKAPEAKDELMQLFPQGVRVKIYSDCLVDAIPEKMEDAISVGWPSYGKGASSRSLLQDGISLQKSYNDIKNHIREQADYVDPATWGDQEVVDSEAVTEQVQAPAVFHSVSGKQGIPMADNFFEESAHPIDAGLIQQAEQLKQDMEFILSDPPSIWGGDTEGQDTVGVNRLLNSQAKGLMSAPWGSLQQLSADNYVILIKRAAQLLQGSQVSVKGKSGEDVFDPALILDGEFGCTPDKDSSLPETMADKRNALQTVLTLLAPSGLNLETQPANLRMIKQYSALPDLYIPGEEAGNRQLQQIDQLLKESPVPDQTQMAQYMQTAQQALQTGQQPSPPPMAPSVPVDEQWDDHAPMLQVLKEWLNSKSLTEQQRVGNDQGIANVKLQAAARAAILAKQAAAAAPKPEPPKVSLSMAITDPTVLSEAAAAAGFSGATPEGIAASQVPDQQEKAAKTQHAAAQAQHQGVLAAKEAISPAQGFAHQKPEPAAPGDSKDNK